METILEDSRERRATRTSRSPISVSPSTTRSVWTLIHDFVRSLGAHLRNTLEGLILLVLLR